jgi:hypothetical protein
MSGSEAAVVFRADGGGDGIEPGLDRRRRLADRGVRQGEDRYWNQTRLACLLRIRILQGIEPSSGAQCRVL